MCFDYFDDIDDPSKKNPTLPAQTWKSRAKFCALGANSPILAPKAQLHSGSQMQRPTTDRTIDFK